MKMGRLDGMRGKTGAWLRKSKGYLQRHKGQIEQVIHTAGEVSPTFGAKVEIAKRMAGHAQEAAAKIKGAANQKQ